jgi:hypothetical protein
MGAAAEALAAEGAAAGQGLVRLITFNPRWAEGFDASTAGFLRSFIAPLLALPLYLPVAQVLSEKLEGAPSDSTSLAAAGMAHLINAFGFPALVALWARPLRFQAGYAGFVVVTNWASLLLNALLALATLTVLGGPSGVELFKVLALGLFALSIFVTWRAARETLTHEIAPILLVVVLSVALSALSDEAAAWLVGHLTQ